MNSLATLKVFFDSALLANKKFMLLPYTIHYYTILRLLKGRDYIKNFICIRSNNILKSYLLVELKYLNNSVQKFKIILFKHKVKLSTYLFKDIFKLSKFTGLFLFSTSLGILTLEQLKIFKIGGLLIFYIY